MEIYSIRGAITIEQNTRECIIKNSELLLNSVLRENNINKDNIINIVFSATNDITKTYPAVVTRNMGIFSPIMCLQEMYVEDSLPMCIRVMVTAKFEDKNYKVKHIYLKDAKKLRPDISMPSGSFAIAIDGPAGSGKSTVSKMISKELNFIYVDTGAMFRTVTLYCLQKNINCENFEEVETILDDINIKIEFEDGIQQIYLNNINVTEKIRTQEIAKNVSNIAKIPIVREKLLYIQQELAKTNNVVMDGRDIGTNVLPNANVKIFLDANIDERAKRRCDELEQRNEKFEYNEVKRDIIKRDDMDKNRKISPLIKAEDAIVIDTTHLDIYEVSDLIIKLVKENIK